jgi:hypothetical protein
MQRAFERVAHESVSVNVARAIRFVAGAAFFNSERPLMVRIHTGGAAAAPAHLREEIGLHRRKLFALGVVGVGFLALPLSSFL